MFSSSHHHHPMSPPKASTFKKNVNLCRSCSHEPRPADPSAVNVDAGEQLLQGVQLLIGLLDLAVSLHVAGDVVPDLVHQGDGVGLVSPLHRRGVLFDDLGKLGLLQQLRQTG